MRSPVILLAAALLLASPVVVSAATNGPVGPPTELWDQFPLDPAAQPGARPAITPPVATTPTPPSAPAATPARRSGGSSSIRGGLLGLLGALVGLIALTVAIRRVRLRPTRAAGAAEVDHATPVVAEVEVSTPPTENSSPPNHVDPQQQVTSLTPVDTEAPLAPPVRRRATGDGDLAAQVVAQLREGLDTGRLSLLGEAWSFRYGAGTGADAWSGVIDRRLDDDTRDALRAAGCRPGDPVLLLPPGEEGRAPWQDHPEVLVPAALPDGLLFGYVDPHRLANIVAPRPDAVPKAVLTYLGRWRPLLERRPERSRSARAPWWEPSRRPVDAILAAPKLIIARRARSGRVAIDHEGGIYADSRSVLAVPRSSSARLDWGCALMASEVAGLWLDGADTGPRATPETRLRDVGRLAAMPQPETVNANVTDLVSELSANRRALSLFVDTSPGLREMLGDAWNTSAPGIDAQRVIDTLPVGDRVPMTASTRIGVHGNPDPDRELVAVSQSDGSLALRDGRRIVGRISGDSLIVGLVSVLMSRPQRLADLRIPRDPDALLQRIDRREQMMKALLTEGLDLAEAIEREVAHALGLSGDLVDQIVDRARRGVPRADDTALVGNGAGVVGSVRALHRGDAAS